MTRRGFTMMEVLICLVVVAILSSMGLGAFSALRRRGDFSAAAATVAAVAAAIEQYPLRTWSVSYDHDGDDPEDDGFATGGGPATPQRLRAGRIFDCDDTNGPLGGDGLIDGQPATVAGTDRDGPFATETLRSGYTGFLAMTHAPISGRFIDPSGRPRDAWRKPLRIAWAAGVYGTAGFGVWSAGRDGLDGTADDIISWSKP
ncbi:MAG: prepilin-type N-terminal cleavage/methylation domain-containing protein [Planctomycetes bacterium]|nr:prepilin-type N-terminal cleavage/methylation domain-containing protein [Planctomycetota bacterium]